MTYQAIIKKESWKQCQKKVATTEVSNIFVSSQV
jgi:hypothetical protein